MAKPMMAKQTSAKHVLARPLPYLALAALALAACGTPQERCINRATGDLRTLTTLVDETQANIDRGFAYQDYTVERSRWTHCRGEPQRLPDGKWVPGPMRMCLQDYTDTVRRPVSIDLAAEKAKLAGMQKKQAELAKSTAPVIAACRAQFPE